MSLFGLNQFGLSHFGLNQFGLSLFGLDQFGLSLFGLYQFGLTLFGLWLYQGYFNGQVISRNHTFKYHFDAKKDISSHFMTKHEQYLLPLAKKGALKTAHSGERENSNNLCLFVFEHNVQFYTDNS